MPIHRCKCYTMGPLTCQKKNKNLPPLFLKLYKKQNKNKNTLTCNNRNPHRVHLESLILLHLNPRCPHLAHKNDWIIHCVGRLCWQMIHSTETLQLITICYMWGGGFLGKKPPINNWCAGAQIKSKTLLHYLLCQATQSVNFTCESHIWRISFKNHTLFFRLVSQVESPTERWWIY